MTLKKFCGHCSSKKLRETAVYLKTCTPDSKRNWMNIWKGYISAKMIKIKSNSEMTVLDFPCLPAAITVAVWYSTLKKKKKN